MVAESLGVAVSFNGCIYNYRDLREELRGAGYAFRSTSHAEVILAAYHRWDEDFAEHLVGMFAAAIVDRGRRRLVLARHQPLYLAETPGRVRFASTLPALLAAGDVDIGIGTGRPAPLPVLVRDRSGAPHHPQGCSQAAACDNRTADLYAGRGYYFRPSRDCCMRLLNSV